MGLYQNPCSLADGKMLGVCAARRRWSLVSKSMSLEADTWGGYTQLCSYAPPCYLAWHDGIHTPHTPAAMPSPPWGDEISLKMTQNKPFFLKFLQSGILVTASLYNWYSVLNSFLSVLRLPSIPDLVTVITATHWHSIVLSALHKVSCFIHASSQTWKVINHPTIFQPDSSGCCPYLRGVLSNPQKTLSSYLGVDTIWAWNSMHWRLGP